MFHFLWLASRGHRLRPWRSPYLRWRIETYSGIPAESITGAVFFRFVAQNWRQLLRFLRWAERMNLAR